MGNNRILLKFSLCLLLSFVGVQSGTGDHNDASFSHRDITESEEVATVQEGGKMDVKAAESDHHKDCTDGVDVSCNPSDTVSGDDTPATENKLTDPKTSEDVVSESNSISENENNDDVDKGNRVSECNENVEASDSNKTNYTFIQWLKFVIEPIIEEFREGIYPKLTEKSNITANSSSISNETSTVEIESVNNNTSLLNTTDTEISNSTESSKKVKFQCTGKNVTDNVNATVKLITSARLLQLLNFEKNETENVTDCLLVMFYAPWCLFCAKVAPHYNALARAFPQLDFVAVDTAQFSNLLARFGTVSVPNILVFHQSRAAVKFNQTERTFDNFVSFIRNSTGLEPNATVNVTEADYLGPVPSVPTSEPDYLLLISWIFVIFCSSCMFVKSNKGQQWINRVRVLWQEHQHID